MRSTVSIFLQTSTAMMSAPSCASRTACARPCPRAAPVTNATLPSTRPAMVLQSSCRWNCRCGWWMSGNDRRHGIPAADRSGLGLHRIRPVDVPGGETLENFFERDASLHPGQRVAHAEVGASPKCHVRLELTVDVEDIAVG